MHAESKAGTVVRCVKMGRGLEQAPSTQRRACFFLAICMSEVVCC